VMAGVPGSALGLTPAMVGLGKNVKVGGEGTGPGSSVLGGSARTGTHQRTREGEEPKQGGNGKAVRRSAKWPVGCTTSTTRYLR
jgi:hypothetical protein